MNELEKRIEEAFRYLEARGSRPILYRRFKELSYDPEHGEVKTFWEVVAVNALVWGAKTWALGLPGGYIPGAECIIAIPARAFSRQPGETEAVPRLGDEAVIGDTTWEIFEVSRQPYYWTDPVRALFFIGLRRKS